MNAFQAQLLRDLDDTFLNLEEWGEKRVINGKEIISLIDDEKLTELKAKAQFADGIHRAEVLIYVKAADLEGGKPAKGAFFSIGKKQYRVYHVSGIDLLEIILEANKRQ